MIQLAIDVALEAGKFLKQSVGNIKTVETKLGQETNLVTEIDRKSEELIIGMIRKKYPDHDFLAEESGSHDQKSEYRWIIDPLDGTLNFTHGVPLYSVSIAVEHRGEIIAGWSTNRTWANCSQPKRGRGHF